MLKSSLCSQKLLRVSLLVLLVVCLASCASGIERPSVHDASPDLVSPTVIYLVRHAEKLASDSSDPALSEVGKIRAQALAQMLNKASIDALFASDYQRTRLTLKPLAEEKQISVHIYDASDSVALVETILSSYAGKVVVVAGHSNTIPELVALLGRTHLFHDEDMQLETDLGDDEYDRLFVVVRYAERTPVTLELSYPVLPVPPGIQ